MVEVFKTVFTLAVCHFIGDYVLQTDFIANSKGTNLWHMIAHCVLYSAPFAIAFGISDELVVIIATHFVIDSLKARWNKIGYAADQLLHIFAMAIYFFRFI